MRWRLGVLTVVAAVALLSARPAFAQADPQAPLTDPSLSITVTATRLDEARSSIQPSLGATTYSFTPRTIDNVPLGENAPLNQVLLRAPGVVQDSFGQIHVRGDMGNVQYRLDGVQLPEGLSLFNNVLATRYAAQMALLTGALPAQYGLQTAGIVDITLKSGTTNPGADLSVTGGSRNYAQPAFSYGGRSGKIDYFAAGQYIHSGLGIDNPTSSFTPIHDDTDQWYGLMKVTGIVDESTRLSLIAGGASSGFQIPNTPFVAPNFTVNGINQWNSSILDQRQWEQTYFAIASLQKSYQDVNFQLSGFTRYSSLSYQPDPLGDLLYNGIAPWTKRTSFSIGVQGDGSWKVANNHTLRGGFLVQRERATSTTQGNTLPLMADPADPDGSLVASDSPVGFADGSDLIGWTYGVYLQDEWRVTPTVTVNFGLRFDAINGATQENQLSPRINLVWEPSPTFTAHIGYSRYFTPPPLLQISAGSIAALAGTVAFPEVTANDPVRAERADYFDVGVTAKPLPGLTLGLGAYYKIAQNSLDFGQFGAPVTRTSFNYANVIIKGVEFNASYDEGPWSVYFNGAFGNSIGKNINSAQFSFEAAELAYIANNFITLDHTQGWTFSTGAAYTFNANSEWATKVSADMLFGSGLRTTVVTPNDQSLPNYAVVNASLAQKIPIGLGKGTQLRFDVINLFDNQYQIRNGQGIGVGASQFGQRQTFLLTLAQKF
ncbi:Outer membrane receptor proteins, mostly Fe transport [Rhodospirillales bacterium URHD0017]|nr:Outer membrane receptor proteins, mostly Fe transport [Rhodospirillales bacterium URHD0017]